MGGVTLSTGQEITIDTGKLTVKEWRGFVNPRGTVKSENEIVMKVTGITNDDIDNMLWDDFRMVVKSIMSQANRPLDDPNSQSAST